MGLGYLPEGAKRDVEATKPVMKRDGVRNLERRPGVYLTDVPSEVRLTKAPIHEVLWEVSRDFCKVGNAFRFGVSFVFYSMQLREKKHRNSVFHPATAVKAYAGNGWQRGSSNTLGSFVVGLLIPDNTPRMNSRVEKAKLDLVCSHCSKRIKWAWLIQYHSYQYTQLVYVCSECEQVIRIENAPKAPRDSSVLSDLRLQRKK